ncbi:MAG: hypothetical protein K2F99_06665, partial [Muribaculaceae bacterium]|nr:hypothetical protein [Muribaculaceae bacterium]
MDKSYIVRSDDPLPAGVKESDSIEDFLDRVYAGLEIKPSQQIRIAVSPKIDGVSVNGTVSGNYLLDPQTRGDESASMRILGLDKMQITDINPKDVFGIQFECFLTDSDMVAVQEVLGREEYANNRNAVAGIINRLCTSDIPDVLPYLSFYPIEAEGLDMDYVDRVEFLENFRIVPQDMLPTEIITGDFNFLLRQVQEIFDRYDAVRGKLSYNIDGLVITVADDVNQEILGRKGRTNQYQIALKFDPENALAIVDHIEMDCGRKGYRTPQVYLSQPVILGGAKYDHIPVLSANLFEKLGLRVGSVVNVHRVGDVIPSITMVNEGVGQALSIDGDCPICGEPMVVRNSKMFCSNPNCTSNKTGRILSLFEGIKLDGYSSSFVDELCRKTNGIVSTPGALLDVDEELLKDIGMNGKIEQRFPSMFEAAMKRTPDYVILGSYGIPDLGRARARDLLKAHGSMFNFIYTYENEGVEGLELGANLGKIGEKIEEFFNTYPETTEEIFKSLTAYMNADYMKITEN